MKRKASRDILEETLDMLTKAKFWLKKSYDACQKRPIHSNLSEEDMEVYELLSGRFGRAVDILFNKVFRSIAWYEFEETTSMLDTLNFMNKKGIIESIILAREIKPGLFINNPCLRQRLRLRKTFFKSLTSSKSGLT